MSTNIFLIGFMGSGKTHWGRIWAAKNRLSFFDLDECVEENFKMKVDEIFEKEGEKKFRELERLNLEKFETKKDFILACGGGTPCFNDNVKLMKSIGNVIYLRATPEGVLKNVISEIDKRPLLKNVNPPELLAFIEKKIKEREPFYDKADKIMDVEDLDENTLSGIFSNIVLKGRNKESAQ